MRTSFKLAVCSWSLQPESPGALFDSLSLLGLKRIQLALKPLYEGLAEWRDFGEQCAIEGVEIVSGMFEPVGEDYSSLDSIRRTGGLVPASTWEKNLSLIENCAKIAADLNIDLVTFHAGFIPHVIGGSDFEIMVEKVRCAARIFGTRGVTIALETGQETAEAMKDFIDAVNMSDVGVNFDPANMILYDKGDPVAALKTLYPAVKQCHIKDACRTRIHGKWGEEVVAGTGEVNWPEFFSVLAEKGYEGALCIEREAGTDRVGDIASALRMVDEFSTL